MELHLSMEVDAFAGEFVAGLNYGEKGKQLGIRPRRIYNNRFIRVSSKNHLLLDEKRQVPKNRTLVYIKQCPVLE
jgi:hypothetical protein